MPGTAVMPGTALMQPAVMPGAAVTGVVPGPQSVTVRPTAVRRLAAAGARAWQAE